MKGLIVNEFSPYSQIGIGDLPDPKPARGEVVADIEYSEVNFPDILYIEGKYQNKPSFPFSPGLAGAGRISAVGEDATPNCLGERVLCLPSFGSHAEKLAVPYDWCFPIPDEMPSKIAAAFGLVYQTAYFALVARARIKKGDNVFVLGATGGIGMASLQLAKALGAHRVIAATRKESAMALAKSFGADEAISLETDSLKDDVKARILDFTDGQGVDIVIDPVGEPLASAALRTLAWSGRYVVVGFASGQIPTFAANYLLVKNIEVSGLQWTDYRRHEIDNVKSAQAQIFSLWQSKKVQPHISEVYPLEDAALAFDKLSRGDANGKILFSVNPEVAT